MSSKSSAVLGSVALLLLAGGLAIPVAAAAATLSISPVHAPPGAQVTLTGSSFLPNTPVSISFSGVPFTAAITNSGGGFVAVFSVPNEPPGTYTISANDGKNLASIDFTVDPGTTTTSTSTTSTTTTTTRTTSTTSTSSSTTSSTSSSTSSSTTSSTTSSTSTTTSSSPASSSSSQTTTSTVTVTANPPEKTVTVTETQKPGSTSTTTASSSSAPLVTSTVTQLAPGATTTVSNRGAAVTVTVTAAASQNETGILAQGTSIPLVGAVDNTALYFFAGVGVLIAAISGGILAYRSRVNKDYGREISGKREQS